jgi:hypothetical protein
MYNNAIALKGICLKRTQDEPLKANSPFYLTQGRARFCLNNYLTKNQMEKEKH